MQCQASTRQVGKVAIVDFSGGITAGGGTALLRTKIKELTTAGHKNVLLNIREVNYLDSAALGELVEACTTLRNLGGDLKLVHPQERITHLLKMTKLSTILKTFADEPAALQSF
jgi:anti-sigma B factor antagonist